MSLGYMTLNDRQDVMEGRSCHGAVPQTHGVTQHQSVQLLSSQAADFVELQLGPSTTVSRDFTQSLTVNHLVYLLGEAGGEGAHHGPVGDSPIKH